MAGCQKTPAVEGARQPPQGVIQDREPWRESSQSWPELCLTASRHRAHNSLVRGDHMQLHHGRDWCLTAGGADRKNKAHFFLRVIVSLSFSG